MSNLPRNAHEYREWWQEQTDVPYGCCWCGCGQATGIVTSQRANTQKLFFTNQPKRYVYGHHNTAHARTRRSENAREYKAEWTTDRPDVPYGLCWCGCGKNTPTVAKTNPARRTVKGEPARYWPGHAHHATLRLAKTEAADRYRLRWKGERPNIPYGKCWCGCGRETKLITDSRAALDKVAGEPEKYIFGHNLRSSPLDYITEDRGFGSPCWIWQLSGNLYGMTHRDGRHAYAHRVFYEALNGPLPDGLHLHHLCEQKRCVNPDHLMPVTRLEHAALHRSG